MVAGRVPDAVHSDFIVRTVPELSCAHPRIAAVADELAHGSLSEEFETCVQDLAQSIGRELVGCGSVIVHDLMTSRAHVPAAEAIRRLALGSRGIIAHGAPLRQWVVFCHDAPQPRPAVKKGKAKARSVFAAVEEPLAGARYAVASLARRAQLAKALRLRASQIAVVPSGIDAAEFLDLTPSVARFALDSGLLKSDAIILTPTRALERSDLSRGLQIVKAMARLRRNARIRWILTSPVDAEDHQSRRVVDRLVAERERMGLRESVTFLSQDVDWARPRPADADVRSLHRIADCLFLPGTDASSSIAVLEGALSRQVLVLGAAPAFAELAKDKGTAVRLGKSEAPQAAAAKILKAIEASPGYRLRRRALRELSWDAVVAKHLVPLIAGGK
jgi:hypothetical protein